MAGSPKPAEGPQPPLIAMESKRSPSQINDINNICPLKNDTFVALLSINALSPLVASQKGLTAHINV